MFKCFWKTDIVFWFLLLKEQNIFLQYKCQYNNRPNSCTFLTVVCVYHLPYLLFIFYTPQQWAMNKLVDKSKIFLHFLFLLLKFLHIINLVKKMLACTWNISDWVLEKLRNKTIMQVAITNSLYISLDNKIKQQLNNREF